MNSARRCIQSLLSRRTLSVMTGLLCVHLFSAIALADSVRIGTLWYDEVTILDMVDGQLVYQNVAGVELRQPLEKIAELKVTAFPELEQAAAAMADNKPADAVNLLGRIENAPKWLEPYVQERLIEACVAANRTAEAVEIYISLVRSGAHAAYLDTPPLESLAKANDRTRQRVAGRLAELQKTLKQDHPAYESVTKLAQLAQGDQKLAEQVQEQASVPLNVRIPVPSRLLTNEDDLALQLLIQGKNAEARDKAIALIQTEPAGVSRRFYILGMAQIKLADEARQANRPEAEQLYKDAGLSLMRVVVHFPKSDYTGSALMEVGYVHLMIGRREMADELLTEARSRINANQDAHLLDRLQELRKQLQQTQERE